MLLMEITFLTCSLQSHNLAHSEQSVPLTSRQRKCEDRYSATLQFYKLGDWELAGKTLDNK